MCGAGDELGGHRRALCPAGHAPGDQVHDRRHPAVRLMPVWPRKVVRRDMREAARHNVRSNTLELVSKNRFEADQCRSVRFLPFLSQLYQRPRVGQMLHVSHNGPRQMGRKQGLIWEPAQHLTITLQSPEVTG